MARPQRTCSIPGCVGAHVARGLCGRHYKQASVRGTLPPGVRPPSNDGPCSVEGCEKGAQARGLCTKHYQRMRIRGTTDAWSPPKGEESPGWVGGEATYRTVHSRLVAARGKASNHECVDCGDTAREWSYDHTDPESKHDDRGGDYSVDLDRYEPRCRTCHFYFDKHSWLNKPGYRKR